MEELSVELNKDSYKILFNTNYTKINNCFEEFNIKIKEKENICIITDQNVEKLYLDNIINSISQHIHNSKINVISVNVGEQSKSIRQIEDIIESFLNFGMNRDSLLISLGGGVVGDITGFVASIYMRGLDYVQIPTTLLSMVDSSVGGKTGINFLGVKNIIGSFYQPKGVIINSDFLKTLDKRNFLGGMAEVIKYGIISDYNFLKYIEYNLDDIINLNKEKLNYIIKKSLIIKASVVSEDERELDLRKVLNQGHTIAHGLEGFFNNKINHGEAVLLGTLIESFISYNNDFINEDYYKEINSLSYKLIDKLNLDIKYIIDSVKLNLESFLDLISSDKKNRNNRISFIVPVNKSKVREVFFSRVEVKEELMKWKN